MRTLSIAVAAVALALAAQCGWGAEPGSGRGPTPGPSTAQGPEIPAVAQRGWALTLDNDLLAFARRDFDYTGGLSLTLTDGRLRQWPLSPVRLADPLDLFVPAADRAATQALDALQIGLMAFTPENLRDPAPQPWERPYASLVFLSAAKTYVRGPQEPVYSTSVAIGMLGLDVAKALQRSLHKGLGQNKIPQGWRHQISAGGEPTLRVTWSRDALLHSGAWGRGRGEMKWSTDLSAGYLTEAGVGIAGRYGLMNTPWWSFNAESADYVSQPAPQIGAPRTGIGELYVWAGARVRLRAYNALVQGQFRTSEVRVSADRLNYMLAEASAGITWQFSSRWRLSYLGRFQTPEIRDGAGRRDLLWAGIVLSRSW